MEKSIETAAVGESISSSELNTCSECGNTQEQNDCFCERCLHYASASDLKELVFGERANASYTESKIREAIRYLLDCEDQQIPVSKRYMAEVLYEAIFKDRKGEEKWH